MSRRLPLALLLLVLAAGACSRQEEARPFSPAEARCEPLARSGPAEPRNVVFVLTDTTRRDRVGIYGGAARTPRFDAFAREGVLYTAASSQAPWTKPSIATLFTGLPPSAHGVVSHPDLRKDSKALESDVLGPQHATLAESLASAGYQTAAFVSNPWVQRRLGFDQGFEIWDQSMADNATPGERVTSAGLRWLEERRGDSRPYFLYLHYMDAHEPYHPVPEAAFARREGEIVSDTRTLSARAHRAIATLVRDEKGRRLAGRGVEPSVALFELVYDLGVEHFDRALGRLLEGLVSQPDFQDTAVWVTSDHGEALFERGWTSHGHGLYENETGVPLAARLPGVATEGPISCPVGLIDLRRTICDYLGVECQGEDRGTSLFSPAIAEPGRSVLTEGVIGRPRNLAVRDHRHKLLFEPDGRIPTAVFSPGGPYRFYDLATDPTEATNLLDRGVDGPVAEVLRRLRAVAEARAAAPRVRARAVELDDATRKRLEALGYMDPAEE